MRRGNRLIAGGFILLQALVPSFAKEGDPPKRLDIEPPHISSDESVRWDYDIVYVRMPRREDGSEAYWAEFSRPTRMERGADLVLLRPDGSEEVLVSGEDGSVLDPYVSFDGESVLFSKFVDREHSGADIWKIHLPTRKLTRLTDQTFTPNTGAAPWSDDYRTPEEGKTALRYGVYNLGPCPAPGGKIVFTSNRNAFVPPRAYPRVTLQLFVMDDDGKNVEQIGHLNVACALHPVILRDGRVIFSTLESQGAHNAILWGIWSIHPDGTDWAPVFSAFENGGAPSAFHFQTQLSDGSIVIEQYYNQNQKGFGTLYKLPEKVPPGVPGFGPGDRKDPRNRVLYVDVHGKERYRELPFMPRGMEMITPWIVWDDRPSYPSVLDDPRSPLIGKVTHPCGAPDNHLLVAWTLGPIGGSAGRVKPWMNPQPIDSGIYLIREGAVTREPGEMLRIKDDPRFNEQWPRPVVPYRRLYGVDEPARLEHRNDGKRRAELPEGTPFGLVGTSSLYKRESAPGGTVPEGSVTAVTLPRSPKARYWSSWRTNWSLQGADAGLYENRDIHAIRILAQEPRTDILGRGKGGAPRYANHALERMRILGEIPVRKLGEDGKEPLDPDGNPDTSFLAKIPADQPFTFQMIDRDGMTLTMAQTWHQLRPGEVRHDCGGCHAHSQQPTPFEETAASRPDYEVFDLTRKTPLITGTPLDESGKRWDAEDETGLRYADRGVVNVEYYRDIRPILERSCVPCHTREADDPPAGLVFDDDHLGTERAFGHDSGPAVEVPLAYFRLAAWKRYTRPRLGEKVTPHAASRYVTRFQSRRSLLVWKIHGRRFDGWKNEDFPSITEVGDLKSLRIGDERVEGVDYDDEESLTKYLRGRDLDMDYLGSRMPPPEAVESGKVEPLTDEDRRTIVRWIDLGCPIDVDPQYDPEDPATRSFGWMGDDQRPTLALTRPRAGRNPPLERILVGMADAYTGLDLASFRVTADFAIDGAPAGDDLSERFEKKAPGVWELALSRPVSDLAEGRIVVSVKDRQGNVSRIERTFSVAGGEASAFLAPGAKRR